MPRITTKRILSTMAPTIVAGILLVTFQATPASAMTATQSAAGDVAKTAKKVVLESKPKTSSKDIGSLPKGTKTTATGKEKADWIQVTAKVKGKKKTGWVRASTLTDVWDSKGKVTISGEQKVGATLTAKAKFTEAGQRVRVEYHWFRDGKALDWSDGKPPFDWQYNTYTLTPADRGKKISVKATAKASGLSAKSVFSAKTSKISAAARPNEFDINNNSKASVRMAFVQWKQRAQYLLDADQTPVVGANLKKCITGSLSKTQRRYSTSLLNFYRELAGVPRITYDTKLETGAMNAAVLNSVNDQFSHSFTKKKNPKCWSKLSGNVEHSILYRGSWLSQGLARSIPGYISDDNNVGDNVGHRWALLAAGKKTVAFGLTAEGGVEAGKTTGDPDDMRAWTWPSAGWFPAAELPTRWSFANVVPDSETEIHKTANYVLINRTDLRAEVKHDGKTTQPKVRGGWFSMPSDLEKGAYKVTITGSYVASTYNRDDDALIKTENYTEAYTYTVKVY